MAGGVALVNTNPPCHRCGHETYGAGQTCFDHGDQADIGPVYVSERRDTLPVEGRYQDGRGEQRRIYDEEQVLPGFEGLV